MRYFLHMGFDGTNYHGWQKQTNTAHTVQEVVENKLSQLFKEPITVYGCGRTDSGVHASQYIIHINLDECPDFDLKFRLNKNLPDGIAVFDILEVNTDQHCRYDAVARTYDYFIHWKKDPVLIRYSSFYEDLDIDFNLMQKAAGLLLDLQDFRPVCKQPDLYKNTICKITKCRLVINEGQDRMRFTITSDRFLRGMVRICIFFLLEVGSGKMSIDRLNDILSQKEKMTAMKPAFPNGLFLSKVEYPYLQFDESHHLIRMLRVGLE